MQNDSDEVFSIENIEFECPICNRSKIKAFIREYSAPYFGKLPIYSLICPSCGYKNVDVSSLESRPPTRFILKISEPEDLYSRVIRSSSSVIKIPELGLMIESGAIAQSFITNVEGILQRFKDAIEGLQVWTEEKEKAKVALETIEKAIRCETPFTLIIEDPQGVSAIIAENKEKLIIEEYDPYKS